MDHLFDFVQMTATYSNAVLVAILPHFTDVARKLELPFPTPITQSEIRRFACDPHAADVGGYLVLTNGYEFWYHHGHVQAFSSPKNVFRLQDPDLLPKLYGPLRMNEKEAVTLARRSLKKLGYTNDVFDTVEPEVQLESPKERFAVNQGVPQYKVIWHDPDQTNRNIADVCINAEFKHVNGFNLYSKRFWRPNPDVGVTPKILLNTNSGPIYVGGHRLTAVTPAYSNACMNAMMPIFTDYANKLGLPITLPITREQCTNIECWTDPADNERPSVQVVLNNGCRLNFDHGYVSGFYAGDNYFFGNLYGEPTVSQADLYQPQPVSTNELTQLVRQAVHKLGYSEKELHMEGPPDFFTIPENTKTTFFTRYEIGWDFMRLPSGIEGYRVTVEVDAKTKTIKSIVLNNTNLWREPPKIDVRQE